MDDWGLDDWGRYIGEGAHYIVYEFGGWAYRIPKSLIAGRALTPRQRRLMVELDVNLNRRLRRDPELRAMVPKRTIVAPGIIRQRFVEAPDVAASPPGESGLAYKLWEDNVVPRAQIVARYGTAQFDEITAYAGVDDGSMDAFYRRDRGSLRITDWYDSTIAFPVSPSSSLQYAVPEIPFASGVMNPIFSASEARALHGLPAPAERNFYDLTHSSGVQESARHVVETISEQDEFRERFASTLWQIPADAIVNLVSFSAGVHGAGPRTPGGRPVTSATVRWFREWFATERGQELLYDSLFLDSEADHLMPTDEAMVRDFMEVIIASTDKVTPRSLIEPPLERLRENGGHEMAGLALSLGTIVAQIELANSAMVDPPDRAFLRLFGRDEQMRVDGELEESAIETMESHYRDYIFAEEAPDGPTFNVDDPRPGARIRIAEEMGLIDHFFTLSERDIVDYSSEFTQRRYDINRRMYRIVAEIRSKAPDISRDKLWTETRRRLIERFPAVSELPERLF